MKFLYVLRVALVSVEALIFVCALFFYSHFSEGLQRAAESIELNGDVVKYLMFLPVALAVWVFNESRLLLQEDKQTIRILAAWSDYWKLKAHTWTGLLYASVFAVMSLIPWATREGISTGEGLLLFLASFVGQLAVAFSVYAARMKVRELIARL